MKTKVKICLVLAIMTIVLYISGCSRSSVDVYYENDLISIGNQNSQHYNSELEQRSLISLEEHSTNRNSLTKTLLEWFSKGVDNYSFEQQIHIQMEKGWTMFHREKNAYSVLVDLDGNGSLGVFALRHEIENETLYPFGRLFYLYGNEVYYKDLGLIAGFMPALTSDGRIFQFSQIDGGVYTLFDLIDGNLNYSFTVYRVAFDSEYDFRFYYGGFREAFENYKNSIPMNKEDFNNILTKYGLKNHTIINALMDETEKILSMTF